MYHDVASDTIDTCIYMYMKGANVRFDYQLLFKKGAYAPPSNSQKGT